jgi:hypothetical protein
VAPCSTSGVSPSTILLGQAFGDGGLADAGIAHQKRVVLAAAAQHLDAALDLVSRPISGSTSPLARLGVQIDAVFRQRDSFCSASGSDCWAAFFLALGGAGDGAAFAIGRVLGDAMGDEVHRVVARHVLLLQEVGRVRFALGEDRDQHVGAGHLGAARGLHVDRGALDHALEGGGRHGLGAFDIGDEGRQIIVDEI